MKELFFTNSFNKNLNEKKMNEPNEQTGFSPKGDGDQLGVTLRYPSSRRRTGVI